MKKNKGIIVLTIVLILQIIGGNSFGLADNKALFSLKTDDTIVNKGGDFTVDVNGNNLSHLYGYETVLSFDRNQAELVKAENSLDGYGTEPVIEDNKIYYAYTKIGNQFSDNPDQRLVRFVFRSNTEGTLHLTLESVKVVDSDLTSKTYLSNQSIEIFSGNSSPSVTPESVSTPTHSVEKTPGIPLTGSPAPSPVFSPSVTPTTSPAVSTIPSASLQEFRGYLMDEDCSSTTKPEKHTRACMLMPECIASGYGIDVKQADGTYKFYKFDFNGHNLALKIVQNTIRVNNLAVIVKGSWNGSILTVSEIVEDGLAIVPTSNSSTVSPLNTDSPVRSPVPASTSVSTTPKEEPAEKNPSLGNFTDIADHWALKFIRNLVEKGYLKGYEDGTIRPDAQITRAEAAALIVNVLGYSPEKEINLKFKDEKSIPGWAEGYIKTAVKKGIIKGYEDNTVRASDRISRVETATMIISAFEFGKSDPPVLKYADSNVIPKWSWEYVAKAYDLGIMRGYKDNTLKPDHWITRAEFFAIISHALEQKSTGGKNTENPIASPQPEFKGVLIDKHCFPLGNPEEDTIDCLRMASCGASGYGIAEKQKDGKYRFLKFDEKGQLLAKEILKKTTKESKIIVDAKGVLEGETIKVLSLTEE